MKPVESLHASGWHAALELDFTGTAERTWLTRRRHSGPLLVQRPFYPEGNKVCQVVIVHPPGGIAGGDVLEIDISADRHACVQLTTPGAGKWYRGFGRKARVEEACDGRGRRRPGNHRLGIAVYGIRALLLSEFGHSSCGLRQTRVTRIQALPREEEV